MRSSSRSSSPKSPSVYARPTAAWPGFLRLQLCVGRLDNQIHHKSILVDRSPWETDVLNRIDSWLRSILQFRSHATRDGSMPGSGRIPTSIPPRRPPPRETLANPRRRSPPVCRGRTHYLSVLRQRAKEIRLMRQLGIPLPGNAMNMITQQESAKDSEPKEEENYE